MLRVQNVTQSGSQVNVRRHSCIGHGRAAMLAWKRGRKRGGDEGTRTPDPRDANAVLFQLSYIPTGDGL